MKYIPKHQYSFSNTNPNDKWIYFRGGKPYTGPYIQLSNNLAYAGESLSSMGGRIVKLPPYEYGAEFETENEGNALKYNLLENNIYSFLSKVETPISTKTRPTEEDYERGYYNRFFIKRVNSSVDYKEISSETYKSLTEKDGRYDHNLYQRGVINWAITGNVHKINTLNLKRLQKQFHLINNLFPIINEFQRLDLTVQTDLSTTGGELYYADGTEYIGLYHIHPRKGPMEGATHSEKEHKKLYYTNELPKIDGNEWEDFLNTQINPDGKCKQDVSCAPGFKWVGDPICGCVEEETRYTAQQSQISQEPQEIPLDRSATTTTTQTPISTQSPGPAAPSSGGSGY